MKRQGFEHERASGAESPSPVGGDHIFGADWRIASGNCGNSSSGPRAPVLSEAEGSRSLGSMSERDPSAGSGQAARGPEENELRLQETFRHLAQLAELDLEAVGRGRPREVVDREDAQRHLVVGEAVPAVGDDRRFVERGAGRQRPRTTRRARPRAAATAMVWQAAISGSFWIWVSISSGLIKKPDSRSTSPMRLRNVKPPLPSSSARSPVRT